MRFQSNRASCGPAALHNALQCIGISRSEEELIAISGQTSEGTSPGQLLKAIKAVSASLDEATEKLQGRSLRLGDGVAIIVLRHWLTQGRPLLLCVDEEDHWIVGAGLLGARLCTIDSADNRLVVMYDEAGLMRRWVASDGRYYAILI